MSKGASGTICLLCQCGFRPRPTLRKSYLPTPRNLCASTKRNDNESQDRQPSKPTSRHRRPGFTATELQQQLELTSAADVLRRVMLGPSATNRARSINDNMAGTLLGNTRRGGALRPRRNQPSDLRGQMQTNADNDAGASIDEAIQLLRFQIVSCTDAGDIQRVMSFALGRPDGINAEWRARLVANYNLHHTIKSKLKQTDPRDNLALIGLLQSRLEIHGRGVSLGLKFDALKAAAETHSLPALQRFFKLWQDENQRRGNTLRRGPLMRLLLLLRTGFKTLSETTLAQRRVAILELLLGSDTPDSQAYNLSNHLPSDDLELLTPWLAVLADCATPEAIWNEWQLARSGQRWRLPDHLLDPVIDASRPTHEAKRAEAFIAALCRTGQGARAWQVLAAASSEFDASAMPTPVWDALLVHLHVKPQLPEHVQRQLNRTLLARFDLLLSSIEAQLGVTWRAPSISGAGAHLLASAVEDEAAADELGAADDDVPDAVRLFEEVARKNFPVPVQSEVRAEGQTAADAAPVSTPDEDLLDTLVASVAEAQKRVPAGAPGSAWFEDDVDDDGAPVEESTADQGARGDGTDLPRG